MEIMNEQMDLKHMHYMKSIFRYILDNIHYLIMKSLPRIAVRALCFNVELMLPLKKDNFYMYIVSCE